MFYFPFGLVLVANKDILFSCAIMVKIEKVNYEDSKNIYRI